MGVCVCIPCTHSCVYTCYPMYTYLCVYMPPHVSGCLGLNVKITLYLAAKQNGKVRTVGTPLGTIP